MEAATKEKESIQVLNSVLQFCIKGVGKHGKTLDIQRAF